MEAIAGSVASDVGSVLAAAAEGDEVAFARIIAAHDDAIFGICVAMCRDRTIAADAVAATWVIAWRKLRSVREPAHLRAWLVAIAINEAKTLLKKRSRRQAAEVDIDLGMHIGGQDPADGISSVDLRAALARLDPEDRALLAMRYVVGFNATELASAIGLSPPGTRARLQRLLARLRTELE